MSPDYARRQTGVSRTVDLARSRFSRFDRPQRGRARARGLERRGARAISRVLSLLLLITTLSRLIDSVELRIPRMEGERVIRRRFRPIRRDDPPPAALESRCVFARLFIFFLSLREQRTLWDREKTRETERARYVGRVRVY